MQTQKKLHFTVAFSDNQLILIGLYWCPGPESNRHALSSEGL